MRTTQTMTISLPPAMVEPFDRLRKAENRTRSELVREALRVYFEARMPEVSPTKMGSDPFSGNIVRLREQPTAWRRRVGNNRIPFDVYPEQLLVVVMAIYRRTSTTY
jgi:hypothetical protein